MVGGSFFTDFLHGFIVPFKQFGSALNFIKPGLGSVFTAGANTVDNLVPGKQALAGVSYATSFVCREGGVKKKI